MRKVVFLFCMMLALASTAFCADQNGVLTTATAITLPVNQPSNYTLTQHLVMPGEALEQISRLYYGSEDLTLILADNQFLQYRARFNSTGKVSYYLIYPGDVLNVRIYSVVSSTSEPVACVPDSTPITSEPWFWIIIAVIFLLVVAVCILIGRSSRNNFSYFGHCFPYCAPFVPQQPQTVQHTYRHQHNHTFGPIPDSRVNITITRVPYVPPTPPSTDK